MSAPQRDSLVFDVAMVERLDKIYSSPQIVGQRARFRELLAARPGELGLEVGCGVGHLACELAREVLPGGRIIAFDSSPDMARGTQSRVEKYGLSGVLDIRVGDAAALDLPSDSVDFVVGVQVYSYVSDIARAMREAARVLRKGGRLAILETDWDMCTYESNDRALTRRVIDARAAHVAHPYLPRQLPSLFRAAGLSLVRCGVYPIMETRYEPDSFGVGFVGIARDAAIQHGVSPEEADAWAADIRSRTSDGDYFFCTNRLIFVASK
jgi:ubiquinone/menaquinone biosynthesis C-methylase UbiE